MKLNSINKDKLRIGVVGYCSQYFDKKDAKDKLEKIINKIVKNNSLPVYIVSGLTNIGIMAIAYKVASENGYKTVGYACDKALDMELFDVDKKHIIGDKWGDESEEFINNIDVLIKAGGGEQSEKELKMAKKLGIETYECDVQEKVSYCLMGYLSKDSAKEIHEQAKNLKAREVKKPDYHITIRYWLADPKESISKVTKYLDDRFKHPVFIEADYEGETETFGNEKSHVLLVNSESLNAFQKDIDNKLQDLGAPPSDFPDYRAHITVAEGVTKSVKIKNCKVLINKWVLTTNNDSNEKSKIIWEKEFC
jgi:2'-5' RNA ligase